MNENLIERTPTGQVAIRHGRPHHANRALPRTSSLPEATGHNDAMLRPSLCLLVLAVLMAPQSRQGQADSLARARALHAQSLLIDGHNDYPWALREHDPSRNLDTLDIHKAAAVDHDRHPAAEGGRRRRAVLVGLRAGRAAGAGRRHRHAGADRHRPPHDAEVPGGVRAGADRGRHRADPQERQDRVADRHGRRATRSTTPLRPCACSTASARAT